MDIAHTEDIHRIIAVVEKMLDVEQDQIAIIFEYFPKRIFPQLMHDLALVKKV